jgi:hypothetical protein
MPSVIDAPEVVEYDKHALDERHDLSQEQPQGRVARAGFWRTVVQSMRRYSTHRLRRTSPSDRNALRQLESPMARLAQEHPTLYLLGFFGTP